jgi:DMSO/TMAO reductase YedYZ molybdopterin-dependent catalytic subunit
MDSPALNRREMIRNSMALAALAFSSVPLTSFGLDDPEEGAELIPFLDKQPPGKMVQWERLTSWITPVDDVYQVQHYGVPKVNPANWNLEIGGLVKKPTRLSLADIKARRRKTITATIECSGNSNSPGFMGAIGNVKWTGTPLAWLLKDCEPFKRGIEVAFFGADTAKDELRKNEYTANFSRGLHIADAMREDILLCYEMNGEPLPVSHGAPLRLVVPGWFGIAWVKWLSRIEVLDRRIMSKYMAREYVTLRAEERTERTIWRETSIGPMLVKSIPARVLKLKDGTLRIFGAAWGDGTPLAKIEIKIDDGPWQLARPDKKQHARYSWVFWTFDWKNPTPGEHTLVSRATDAEDRTQPSTDEPVIKLKKTYWEANQLWPRRINVPA